MFLKSRLQSASRAALWHFLGSVAVATMAALLVFGLWYPYPYRELAGGRELFLLVIGVDVVCGPLLTLVFFSPQKSRGELIRDLSLVGLIQLTALAYGLWTVATARPVYLVFDADRFVVVTAADIDPTVLPEAPIAFRHLGYSGPKIIAARVPKADDADYLRGVQLSLRGFGPSLRPSNWREYGLFKEAALAKTRSLLSLRARYPEKKWQIDEATRDIELPENKIGYLPVQGRHQLFWVALISMDDARVVGFLPLDGS